METKRDRHTILTREETGYPEADPKGVLEDLLKSMRQQAQVAKNEGSFDTARAIHQERIDLERDVV